LAKIFVARCSRGNYTGKCDGFEPLGEVTVTHADDEKSPIEHDGSTDAGSPAADAAPDSTEAMAGHSTAPGESGVVGWLTEGGPPAGQPQRANESEGVTLEPSLGGDAPVDDSFLGGSLAGDPFAMTGQEGGEGEISAGEGITDEVPSEEGQPAAEEEAEEEAEKEPGFFGRLAKSDPYMVMLVMAFLALAIGSSAMWWEWRRYEYFNPFKPGEAKKEAQRAATSMLPAEKQWLVVSNPKSKI
jgi:hypothetical protein